MLEILFFSAMLTALVLVLIGWLAPRYPLPSDTLTTLWMRETEQRLEALEKQNRANTSSK